MRAIWTQEYLLTMDLGKYTRNHHFSEPMRAIWAKMPDFIHFWAYYGSRGRFWPKMTDFIHFWAYYGSRGGSIFGPKWPISSISERTTVRGVDFWPKRPISFISERTTVRGVDFWPKMTDFLHFWAYYGSRGRFWPKMTDFLHFWAYYGSRGRFWPKWPISFISERTTVRDRFGQNCPI